MITTNCEDAVKYKEKVRSKSDPNYKPQPITGKEKTGVTEQYREYFARQEKPP